MKLKKSNILNEIKKEKEVTKSETEQLQVQAPGVLPSADRHERQAQVSKPEQAQAGNTKPQAELKQEPKHGVLQEPQAETKPQVQQSAPQPQGQAQALTREPKAEAKPQAQATRPEGQAQPQQKQKQKPYYRPQPQDTISGFVGKDVVLTLRGGSKLKGRLESVTQYDVVITASYKPIIVLKHAIDYVELSEPSK